MSKKLPTHSLYSMIIPNTYHGLCMIQGVLDLFINNNCNISMKIEDF